jgi:hypothetical protein
LLFVIVFIRQRFFFLRQRFPGPFILNIAHAFAQPARPIWLASALAQRMLMSRMR